MVSKFYSKIERKITVRFLVWRRVEWSGLFSEGWIHLNCYKFSGFVSPSHVPLRVIVFYIMGSWGSILDYAVNTCGKKQTCLLSASCLESNKFQVTTHTRETRAYSGCPRWAHQTQCFPHSQKPRAQLPFS